MTGQIQPQPPAAPAPPARPDTYPSPPTALVVGTRSAVDVWWQDGSVEEGVPAPDLLPVPILDDHDFWPNDLIQARPLVGAEVEEEDEAGGEIGLQRGKKQRRTPRPPHRAGVVATCDPAARTAVVRWFPVPGTSPSGPASLSEADADAVAAGWEEETVPVYAIRPHADWAFAVGDVVVRLAPARPAPAGGGGGEGASASASAASPPATVGGAPGKGRLSAEERWCVGEVASLRAGRVGVRCDPPRQLRRGTCALLARCPYGSSGRGGG